VNGVDLSKKGALHFCSSADVDGGMELFTLAILKISARRWRTHLLLPEAGPLVGAASGHGVEVHVIPFRRLRRLRGALDLPAFMIGWLRVQWSLLRLIRKHNIGLVHFSENIDAPFMPAARLAGARVIVRCQFVPHSRLLRRALSWMTRLFAHRIFCISHATVRFLFGERGIRNSKISILRSGGPNAEVFSPDIEPYPLRQQLDLPHDTAIIGMVSRFLRDKGHDRFLDIAESLLKDEKRSYHFVMVGREVSGHEAFYNECFERTLHPPLQGKVTILKDLSRSQLASLYRACDIMLQLPRCEDTFPTVTLEAMATGIPVVALNRGGIGEQIVDGVTGLLISSMSCERISDKLISLIDDPDKRRLMSQASREHFLALVSESKLSAEIETAYSAFL
jgi:glycosyltransferase involved in cell wall biosynthesis